MSAVFKPATFEQWREQQLSDNAGASLEVDCRECDGTGEVECCECGHERECDECDGGGRVNWSDLTDSEKLNYLTRDRYHEAVLADAKAWAGWLCVDPFEQLVAAGFSAYSVVAGHSLRIKEMNS